MVIKDRSVIYFKLGSSFMHFVRTCCTRITIFKHGRYAYRSNLKMFNIIETNLYYFDRNV